MKIYKGSVKDILGPYSFQKANSGGIAGVLFRYTDAFSVFDFGRLPETIPGKGEALCALAAGIFEKIEDPETWREFSKTPEAQDLRRGVSSFATGKTISSQFNELGELLQRRGMRTHYLGGVADESLDLHAPAAMRVMEVANWPSRLKTMAVREFARVEAPIVQVFGRSVADYSALAKIPAPRIIPLEVVFRYEATEVSSLAKRVRENPQVWSDLASMNSMYPKEAAFPAKFEFPVLEFFTKVESTDRWLSAQEALFISGVDPLQFQDMCIKTLWVAGLLKSLASRSGLVIQDAKLEWGLSASGEAVLIDAIGPDEMRLTYKGKSLSKELIREYYRGTPWADSLETAKETARRQNIHDWKRFITEKPPELGLERRTAIGSLYQSLANTLLQTKVFPSAPELDAVVARLEELGLGNELAPESPGLSGAVLHAAQEGKAWTHEKLSSS